MTETTLNLLGAAFILIGAIVPAYLTFKIQSKLRWLTFALFVFCIIHSTYHFALAAGQDALGDNILEPASVLSLLAFGGIYALYRLKQEVRAQ